MRDRCACEPSSSRALWTIAASSVGTHGARFWTGGAGARGTNGTLSPATALIRSGFIQAVFHATSAPQSCPMTMASLAPTRAKAVLHILDGLVATWEGGPKTDNKTFATWEYKSLLFATDPVALDHIGWEIIDQEN